MLISNMWTIKLVLLFSYWVTTLKKQLQNYKPMLRKQSHKRQVTFDKVAATHVFWLLSYQPLTILFLRWLDWSNHNNAKKRSSWEFGQSLPVFAFCAAASQGSDVECKEKKKLLGNGGGWEELILGLVSVFLCNLSLIHTCTRDYIPYVFVDNVANARCFFGLKAAASPEK